MGEAGYYVSEFNANGIATGILYFLDNREKIKSMGEISKNVINGFTWDISAEKIISIYQKLKTNE